jgi:hypothetical protein
MAAQAQPLTTGFDSPFQVNYTANLAFGDSFVTVTNTGANSTVAQPIFLSRKT